MDQHGANPESKPPATQHPLDAAEALRRVVIAWYREVAEDYPWRRTRDPYEILVSEVMLQQTQVATVLGRGYWERWLERFPDVETLAAAGEDEILKAWEGLGYYRRARNLQHAAKAVVRDFGGEFPETYDSIRELPGVGDYTAGAVACLAFGQPTAMVDANIARVLTRLLDFRERIDSTAGKRWLQTHARLLVDPGNPREFNSGLMELGQKHCKPRKPTCGRCPVSRFCQATEPEALPRKKAAQNVETVEEFAWYVHDRRGGRILLQQERGSRRNGLWKLPVATESETAGCEELLRTTYAITRFRVNLRVFRGKAAMARGTWVLRKNLGEIAMASPFRKALERLLEAGDAKT